VQGLMSVVWRSTCGDPRCGGGPVVTATN